MYSHIVKKTTIYVLLLLMVNTEIDPRDMPPMICLYSSTAVSCTMRYSGSNRMGIEAASPVCYGELGRLKGLGTLKQAASHRYQTCQAVNTISKYNFFNTTSLQ